MSRGTAVQLKGTSGRSARSEARWITRASISLPVPVSPVRRMGRGLEASRRARCTSSIGLLGDPQALGVALEGLGRPQRRALLSRRGGSGRGRGRWRRACGWRPGCSDGRAPAAAGRGFPRSRRGAGRGGCRSSGVAARKAVSASSSVQPSLATSRTPCALRAPKRQRLGAPRLLQDGERLAGRECAGGPRVRGAPPPSRGDRIPLSLLWSGPPNPRSLVSPPGYLFRADDVACTLDTLIALAL